MPRTKAISISRPYDARHVSGVGIGAPTTQPTPISIPTVPIMPTMPFPKPSTTSFSSALEPDEIPTHLNITMQNEIAQAQAPKRSNTIAHTLRRPSLRLKTSISRLRGRSSSNSPERYLRREKERERHGTPEGERSAWVSSGVPPRLPDLGIGGREKEMEKRTTLEVETERLLGAPRRQKLRRPEVGRSVTFDSARVTVIESGREVSGAAPAAASTWTEKDLLSRTSRPNLLSAFIAGSGASPNLALTPADKYMPPAPPITATTTTSSQQAQSRPVPHPPLPSRQPANSNAKASPPTRPKRADSGVGEAVAIESGPSIHLTDIPASQRPLGFKEIVAVKSFDERMRLYAAAREFWARADHGLGEWVGGRV